VPGRSRLYLDHYLEIMEAEATPLECVLCGKDAGRYGNNPHPLSEIGVCCDACNFSKVVPTRMILMMMRKTTNVDTPHRLAHSMLTIRVADLPEVLVDTIYYNYMLDIDDSTTCVPEDATICVPDEFFRDSFEPKTFQDVLHIFNIFQYWGARIRAEFYEAILSNPSLRSELAINIKILEEKFPDFEDTDNMVLFMETSDMYELACKATRYDSEELFMGVMAMIDPALIDTELWNCAAQGSIVSLVHLHDVCQMAYENGSYHEFMWPDETTCESAAKVGNVDALIQLIMGSYCRWDSKTMMAAAFYGHVNVLKYAHISYCPCDLSTTLTYASYQRWSPTTMAGYTGDDYCGGSSFDEFWNFWKQGRPITLGELSASRGHVDCLNMFYDYQTFERDCYQFNTTTFTAAVANGHLECLDILLHWWSDDLESENDRELDEMPLVIAASRGDLGLLQKLERMNVFPLDGLACIASISANHLGCLEFALMHTNLVGLNRKEAFRLAIRLNQLECIQLLHEWTDEDEDDDDSDEDWFCQDAAAYNHLNILQFLYENGFPWNHLTLLNALEQGNYYQVIH